MLNVDDCKIEKIMRVDEIDNVGTFLKLGDRTVLIGSNKGLFVIDDITKKDFVISKQKVEKEIDVCALIYVDNDTFITIDAEDAVKEWKIKH